MLCFVRITSFWRRLGAEWLTYTKAGEISIVELLAALMPNKNDLIKLLITDGTSNSLSSQVFLSRLYFLIGLFVQKPLAHSQVGVANFHGQVRSQVVHQAEAKLRVGLA
jgi:hypothetical protein